jgi:tetratricopeptide (TPR) repeat protein
MLDVSIAYVRWLSRLGEKKLRRGDEMFRKFEIGLCEKVLVTTPSHLEALEIVGHAYTHAGKHEQALAVDLKLAALLPNEPIAHYNLACSLSNVGKVAESVESLETAVALGFTDVGLMSRDPDLSNVRGNEKFKELLERIRSRRRRG